MIHFVLIFFGATFIYAGTMMISRDIVIGMSTLLVGLILSIKPAIRLIRLAMESSGIASNVMGGRHDKMKRAKGRSRRDGDEKPTYH